MIWYLCRRLLSECLSCFCLFPARGKKKKKKKHFYRASWNTKHINIPFAMCFSSADLQKKHQIARPTLGWSRLGYPQIWRYKAPRANKQCHRLRKAPHLAMGQKARTPMNIPTHSNRLKWVVHLPQNGTIGFDPQPSLSRAQRRQCQRQRPHARPGSCRAIAQSGQVLRRRRGQSAKDAKGGAKGPRSRGEQAKRPASPGLGPGEP